MTTKTRLSWLALLVCLPCGGAQAEPKTPVPIKAETLGLTTNAVTLEKTTVPKVTVRGEAPGTNKKLARSYPQAPPMIPHSVAEYLPIKRRNACLMCHLNPPRSLKNVTELPPSHFVNRDKRDLALVPKGARKPHNGFFYCVTCHAPQHDVKPLVPNIFKPAD